MKLEIKTPGRTFEFTPRQGSTAVVVGTRAADDVRIEDDPQVSAPHVRLERLMDTWSFTDQFSDAGTFHNGEKKYGADLKVGDVLKIGQSEIRVVALGEPPAPPPEPPRQKPDAVPGAFAFEPLESEERKKKKARPERSPTYFRRNRGADSRASDAAHAPGQPSASASPKLASRLVVVAAVLAAGIGFAVFTAMDELPGTQGDRDSAAVDGDGEGSKLDKDELVARVKALRTDTSRSPQELLDELVQLEKQATEAGFSTGWDFESTQQHLGTKVYREVSLRYNDAAREIGSLQREGKFRESQEVLDAFQEYLDSSPHHERAVSVIRIDKSIEQWREHNTRKSNEVVARSLVTLGEALSRNDFTVAHESAKEIHSAAILDDTVREALEEFAGALRRQAESMTEAPLRAFDKRDDALPPAPENALLPAGDKTGRVELRAFQHVLHREIRNGDFDGREFELWGMTARIEGDPKSSLVYMHYTRELKPGVELEGVARVNLANEAPVIRLSVYRHREEFTRQELLVLLVYAFDHGLMEHAGEIAHEIRRLDESAIESLDEILAAKWGVPIPEGGFPERNGKVVPE